MQLFLCGAFSRLGLMVPFASPPAAGIAACHGHPPRGAVGLGAAHLVTMLCRGSVSSTNSAGSQMSVGICQGSSQR